MSLRDIETTVSAGHEAWKAFSVYNLNVANQLNYTGQVGPVGFTPWTPVISIGGSTTGIVTPTIDGWYLQVNKIVFVQFNIAFSSKGLQTGAVRVTLPVAAAQLPALQYLSISNNQRVTLVGTLIGTMSSGQSQIALEDSGQTGAANTAISDTKITDTTSLQCVGFYFSS